MTRIDTLLTDYVRMQAVGRIKDISKAAGLLTESLSVALIQTAPDSKKGQAVFFRVLTRIKNAEHGRAA